jgi:hypothetical protein
MGSEDIEQLLENDRFKHLSPATLVSYRDNQLDKIRLALADAHLKLCHSCERKLAFLTREAEAQESYVLTEADRAANEQFVRELKPEKESRLQRFKSYVTGLLDAWIILYSREPVRGSEDGDEIWRYESEDGLLTAWAILEKKTADLTVHFSSSELSWEGIRMRFRLGPFIKEVTLEREGDDRVAAKIRIPRRSRARKMKDISIDVL